MTSLEKAVDCAKNVFKTPSLADASIEISDSNLVINSIWSQLDLEKNERSRFQRTSVFDTDKQIKQIHSGRSVPVRNNIWNVKSPNNVFNAIVTSWKEGGEDKQFLEIWKKDTRVANINLTKLDKHGSVYEKSDTIGSFVWSSDSKKIAYLAEAKKETKDKSFFVAKPKSESDDGKTPDLTKLNEYCDDWGEQMVGKSKSVLVVFDVQESSLEVIDEAILPPDNFIGRAVWNDNKGILLNSYYTKPYKLGLIYCPVRK